ncbi:hypothetical protein CEXT_224111 [Caerostris extrusa]|uniref:Uncharacterized protein n=1 Tax=Caerostris extrusa TaxID=172846 RepID=A0AAV4Y7I5_CAEEX|nr:hypothetical protein CEXT_224111 [Caerostris extrusa]
MSSALNNFQKKADNGKTGRIPRIVHPYQPGEPLLSIRRKRLSFLTLLIFWNAFGFSMVTVTKFCPFERVLYFIQSVWIQNRLFCISFLRVSKTCAGVSKSGRGRNTAANCELFPILGSGNV